MKPTEVGSVVYESFLRNDLTADQKFVNHQALLQDVLSRRSAENLATWFASRVRETLDAVRDQIGKVDAQATEAIVNAVEVFYDRFVAPYNIQFVPDFVEPALDGYVRSLIRPAVLRAVWMYNTSGTQESKPIGSAD